MSVLRVSVLMPCYNASKYIDEAVESILSQTYSEYELILVNDGSTDDTLDVMKQYASRDKRIVIINKENTGLADSLNRGLDIARGEWVARLDADDIALPRRLSKQLTFVEDKNICLLGSACVLIDATGKETMFCRYPRAHDEIVRQIEKTGSPFPHSSAFYLRESVIRVGGYRDRLNGAEDVDLWLRLSRIAEIASLHELLVKIRKHSSNITIQNNGTTSIIMGMAARVCHFIRLKGALDPSQADDSVWNQFLDWLSRRLEEGSYLESHRTWSNMRQNFRNSVLSDGRLHAISKFARGLLMDGHAFRILKNRLFTSILPLRLSDQWTNLSSLRK